MNLYKVGQGKEYDEMLTRMKNLPETIQRPTKEEKEQMGRWIIEYLEYAGYAMSKAQPNVYKAMFMASFPLILENGWYNPRMASETEEVHSYFMTSMNRHFQNLLQLDNRYAKSQAIVQGYFSNVKS